MKKNKQKCDYVQNSTGWTDSGKDIRNLGAAHREFAIPTFVRTGNAKVKVKQLRKLGELMRCLAAHDAQFQPLVKFQSLIHAIKKRKPKNKNNPYGSRRTFLQSSWGMMTRGFSKFLDILWMVAKSCTTKKNGWSWNPMVGFFIYLSTINW